MSAKKEFLEEFSEGNIHTMELLREATRQIAYYRNLLKQEERDVLTGLAGRNKYQSVLNTLKEHDTGKVCVMFFDVNGLKQANDTIGHSAGDALIQKAAASVVSICKGQNMQAFRIGGDEFAVIVTQALEGDDEKLLNQWRENLDAQNAVDDEGTCSVSAGAAFGKSSEISDLLKLADERMYADKRRQKGNHCSPK